MDELTSKDLEGMTELAPSDAYLCCDFCGASDVEDLIANNGQGELRPMYRLVDGDVICQKCVESLRREAAQRGEEPPEFSSGREGEP